METCIYFDATETSYLKFIRKNIDETFIFHKKGGFTPCIDVEIPGCHKEKIIEYLNLLESTLASTRNN